MAQDTELFEAIQRNHLADARRLLAAGVSPDAVGASGMTPLGWAALRGSVEMVELLVGAGADIHAVDASGAPPLMLAVASACADHIRIPDHAAPGSDLKRKLRKIEVLVELGADVDAAGMLPAPNEEGASQGTSLCAACLLSEPNVVQLLITLGADPSRRALDGSTAFHFVAIRQGFLERKGRLRMRGLDQGIPTLVVRDYPGGDSEFFEVLRCTLQDSYNKSRPGWGGRDFVILRELLERGVPDDLADASGRSPFEWLQATSEGGVDMEVPFHMALFGLMVEGWRRQAEVGRGAPSATSGLPEREGAGGADASAPASGAAESGGALQPLRIGLLVSHADLRLDPSDSPGRQRAMSRAGLMKIFKRKTDEAVERERLPWPWQPIESVVLLVPGSLTVGDLFPRWQGQLESQAFLEVAPVQARGRTGRMVFGEEDTMREMVARVNPHSERVRPQDYDDALHIGRYFAFCRPSARPGVDLDPDFLRYLGVTSLPAVFPRLGVSELGASELDLHVHPFGRENPPFFSLAVASSPRLVYRAGDVVTVFALCLSPTGAPSGEPASLHLVLGGERVPDSDRPVKLVGGLAAPRWEGLPEGAYTAVLQWRQEEARTSFTVGRYHRAPAHGQWLEGPRQEDGEWIGTVALFLYGTPVASGLSVEVGLDVDDALRPSPRRTMTRGDGCIDVRVPATHPECRVMRVSWEEGDLQTVGLPLPGGDAWDVGGIRAAAAPGSQTTPAAGLHVSVPTGDDFPLRLALAAGETAVLVAEQDVPVAAVTVVLPDADPRTQHFRNLRRGQTVEVPVFRKKAPAAYGFLCMGALCDDGRGDLRVFERALPFFRPTRLEVSCEIAPVVEAGTGTRLRIHTAGGSRATVAVIVQDARHHAAGGLSAAAAAGRLESLRQESRQLEGPEPMCFSKSYLDGLFRLKAGWKAHAALALGETLQAWEVLRETLSSVRWSSRPRYESPRGTILVDLLPAEGPSLNLLDGLVNLGAHVVESLAKRAATADAATDLSRRVFSCPRTGSAGETDERAETVFAGVVETRRGRADILLDLPDAPMNFRVELVAVDPQGLGLATGQGAFESRRAIQVRTDAVPTCVHPLDAGRVPGRVVLQSTCGEPILEIRRDGEAVSWTRGPGDPDFRFPVGPGVYTFSARAGEERHTDRLVVKSADRIVEHVRRIVVLRAGQGLDIGPDDRVYDLRFAGDPEEIFGSCGQALARYEHKCCEQTAAAMLGAWLALVASRNGTRFEALGSLRQGLERLDTMWRTDGFAMYPDQRAANSYWGRGAYRHLCGMTPLRRILGARGPDPAEAEIARRLDDLVRKAEGVYGPPLRGTPTTCQEAWIGFERDPGAAVRCVLDAGWQSRNGPSGAYGCVEAFLGIDAVMHRAETCYGAAVLMSSDRERHERFSEIRGTADWLGGQMRQGGRLYSTVDSAGLVAFLACARRHALFAGEGRVRVDGGASLSCAEAAGLLESRVPRRIECLDGEVRLFVDAAVERTLDGASWGEAAASGERPSQDPAGDGASSAVPGAGTGAGPLRVHLEADGRGCSNASLGSRVDLVVDVGTYEPGMVLHVTLPPCLAREEGGVRLQSFQRDFAGLAEVRVGLTAVERTSGEPWHGTVVLQDMFREERMEARTIGFGVS